MALQQIDRVAEHDRLETCIDSCSDATQAAEWCATECIEMGDPEMSRCIRLCRDVADLTALHVRLMTRESAYADDVAATCAAACEACADECDRFDTAHCRTCADVLRTCADSCREMAAA